MSERMTEAMAKPKPAPPPPRVDDAVQPKRCKSFRALALARGCAAMADALPFMPARILELDGRSQPRSCFPKAPVELIETEIECLQRLVIGFWGSPAPYGIPQLFAVLEAARASLAKRRSPASYVQPVPREEPLPSNNFLVGKVRTGKTKPSPDALAEALRPERPGFPRCASTLGGLHCDLSAGHHGTHRLINPTGARVLWTDRPEPLVPMHTSGISLKHCGNPGAEGEKHCLDHCTLHPRKP